METIKRNYYSFTLGSKQKSKNKVVILFLLLINKYFIYLCDVCSFPEVSLLWESFPRVQSKFLATSSWNERTQTNDLFLSPEKISVLNEFIFADFSNIAKKHKIMFIYLSLFLFFCTIFLIVVKWRWKAKVLKTGYVICGF